MVQHHCGDDFDRSRPDGNLANQTQVVRPAFLHANIAKMNVGRLIDGSQIYSAEDKTKHWRLLGRLEHQKEVFGWDVEQGLWELMQNTACELQHKLRDWKTRRHLCERTKEHVRIVFGEKEEKKGEEHQQEQGSEGDRHEHQDDVHEEHHSQQDTEQQSDGHTEEKAESHHQEIAQDDSQEHDQRQASQEGQQQQRQPQQQQQPMLDASPQG